MRVFAVIESEGLAEVHQVMEEKEVHFGREHVGTAITLGAEFIAVKYGVVWLAWLAALFACLAVWGYTKKLARNHAKSGWGIRVVAVLFVLMATYFVTMPRKHAAVAINGNPTASLVPPQGEPAVDPDPAPKPPMKKTPILSPEQQQSGKDNVQTGPITTGPCSNVFSGGNGNQGSINCTDVPPQITTTKLSENVLDDGLFKTEFRLDIIANKAFLLHVRTSAPNLVDYPKIDDVRPSEQGGKAFQATSINGLGYIETDYSNIESGSYIVTVKTLKPNTVRIDCR